MIRLRAGQPSSARLNRAMPSTASTERKRARSTRSRCSASRLPPSLPAISRFGAICVASMPPRGAACGGGVDRVWAGLLPQPPPPHFHQLALYDLGMRGFGRRMMTSSATVKSRVIVLAGVAVAAAAGAVALHTDLLLSRGFGHALDAPRPGLSFDTVAAKEPAPGAAAGDEGYWLTRAEVESPTPFAKPLAVGDRITIAGRDGRERHLEVVDLKAIGGNAARAARATHPRLLLVICRVTGETTDRADAPVRFIIEAEPPAEPA